MDKIMLLQFVSTNRKMENICSADSNSSQMKGLLKVGCTIGMIAAFLIPGIAGSSWLTSNQGGDPIIIRQNPADPIGAPRSPEGSPFFAELMNGYVILGSSTPCGTVSVHISSTAGDDYSTNFDTSDVTIIIPISGTPGDYTLSITTPLGAHFIGEFTI